MRVFGFDYKYYICDIAFISVKRIIKKLWLIHDCNFIKQLLYNEKNNIIFRLVHSMSLCKGTVCYPAG